MATHTSGTWAIQYSDQLIDILSLQGETEFLQDVHAFIIHAGFRPIAATVTDDPSETTPEDEANANLIAAAPDLLAAVELALFAVTKDADTNNGKVDRHAVAEAMRAAIAKAKGE